VGRKRDRRGRGPALLRAHGASTCAGSCVPPGPTSRGRALCQGGSTITQQSSRTRSAQNAPTIARKLREAALAWRLERLGRRRRSSRPT
jgi:hypothetical protein